ncbi:MAG: efflux RND transporter permease subunit [bacterium]|nr:efflux RND transporter permease subunit [bacterium]
MMRDFFHWAAAFSIQHRRLVLGLLAILTLVSAIGYVNPRLLSALFIQPQQADQVASEKAPSSDEAEPPNVSPISLSNSDAVLVVEAEDFFTPRAVTALGQVVDELEAMDQVASVLWMDCVPILNIFGLPEPLLPRATASQARFDKSREKAMQHPLVGGQLLSDDTRTLLMLVNLDYYFVFSDEDATTALRETAERVAANYPDLKFRFRVTGRVPSAIAAISRHEANQLKYQLFGYGMILLMSLILFRGIRAVIIVSLAPAIGIFWTLGCIRYFEYNDNPLIDVIVPILVSLVGLTDGVHLMVQIRKLRAAGADYVDASIQGLQQVGLACFLTSLTTAIGFGSLMLADSVWVQQFGLCSMIGVLLCFVAVTTIIPLACSSWLGQGIERGLDRSLIDQNLGRIEGLITVVLRRRRLLSASGILLTAVLVFISLSLKPDHRNSDSLPESAEATQALFHVDRAFGGLEFSRVEINWDATLEPNAPEILQVVQQVDDLLRAEELIGHPLSIRNLIDAQPGSGPLEERMTLLELLPPPLKRAFYTPERRQAVVNFRVQDLGIAAYGPVFERLEQELAQIEEAHPNFQVSLAGGAVRRWRNLYQIVVDLAASLGTASLVIWIVLTIFFRSLRLGLISIVPNAFPLALTGAYLVFAGYNLEIVMVCNFTVCLGIAVDDTIHFLTRYLEEGRQATSNDLAIRRAFTGVGTALIMTTAVLVAGFGIVTFSDSRDHHIFATMGAITVASALFCDLVFLPALLACFGRPEKKALVEGGSIRLDEQAMAEDCCLR